MALTKVAIVNASTLVTDAVLGAYVPDLQTQVTRDFAPVWGIDADLEFIPHGMTPPATHWWLVVMDNADVQGALGYHDLTSADLPIGKVFAQQDLQYGASVSATISHELLEMLADPYVNLTVEIKNKFWFYETADAVEADTYGYKINSTLVSDFVFPSYFEPARSGAQYDFGHHLRSPCPALLPGGYMGYIDPRTNRDGQVVARLEKNAAFRARPYLGSRRLRRMVPIEERISSDLALIEHSRR